MKKPILFFVFLFSANFLIAQGSLTFNPAIPNVFFGNVDFTFDLDGGGARYDLSVEVSFDNGGNWDDIPPAYISGQLINVEPGQGISLQWNAMSNFPGQVTSEALLRVTAQHVCGTDFTFNYSGEEVTYGTVSVTYNEGTVDEYSLCWLDRNLGAEPMPFVPEEDATGNTDIRLYGDLFQWGRLDDGHQVVDWTSSPTDVTSTTSVLSTTNVPGHSEFIATSDSPNDWRSTQNDDLWQGTDGINNPCPTGWRVPDETELDDERLSWGSTNSSGAFDSPLKWPTTGFRLTNGPIFNEDATGRVWSSSVDGYRAISLYFFSIEADLNEDLRSYGSSVRCVRDAW